MGNRAVALPGGTGLWCAPEVCAQLQDVLRSCTLPELREVRAEAYAVAREFTARQAENDAIVSKVTVAQAAKMMRCSLGNVRRMIHSDELKGHKDAHGNWLITRASVDRRMNDGARTRSGANAAHR